MNLRLVVFFLLLHAAAPVLVHAQNFDENSVPEPTRFDALASDQDADVIVIGSPGQIESSESAAEIAAVQIVAVGGERKRGIRVLLKNSDETDQIYLDADQALQFRDELAGLDWWYERRTTCEAISYCVHGVARCRPSQGVRQAYCPSVYSTPEGEHGIFLSTSRQSFRFPSMRTAVFVDAISAAIGALNGQEASTGN